MATCSLSQTISVVIDNPIERRFFRGYTVRFNTGGGNTVYAGTPQSRMAVGTFEYFTNGQWFATGTGGNPTLFDTDTDQGMRIDLTLTGVDTFNLVMTPLDNPGLAFSKSGTLAGPAGSPIDWVEFELFNTDSDFFPVQAQTLPLRTSTSGAFRSFRSRIPRVCCLWVAEVHCWPPAHKRNE